MHHWPSYTLIDGRLHKNVAVKVPEGGFRMLPNSVPSFPLAPNFVTTTQAELWLALQHEPGTVQERTFKAGGLGG